MKTLLIAGANGFIGRQLTSYAAATGWQVVGLARRKEGLAPDCRYVNWDGKTLDSWTTELDQCDAVVNLSGKSVNCRFTPENRKAILESRLESTSILGEALANCNNPPSVWMNASGANYYSDSQEQANSEKGVRGEGFMSDVVVAWEEAFFQAQPSLPVRQIALRTSMVLGDEPGNPLRTFKLLSKFGLGGKIGDGRQMVSWVHVEDVCRAILWLIDQEDISGPVNMTAPEPLTNAQFMARFRQAANMSIGLPAAAWMAKIGAYVMGIEPELILNSLWLTPDKLLEHGYEFTFPELCPGDW